MRRLVDEQLAAWKSSSRRKPLIVRGARQVGKTWSIERFGRLEFDDIAKIDFERRPDVGPLFDGDLSPLKDLPEGLEGAARELGDLVEEEHPPVGQCDLSRSWVGTPTDKSGVTCRVVG